MSKITTTGLDLAKNVFHVVCCDERGKVIKKRMLKRREHAHIFCHVDPLSDWHGVVCKHPLLGSTA